MSTRTPRDVERDEAPLFERWHGRSACPSPDLLLPAMEGTLVPEARAASVRAHIQECGLCRELAEVMAAPEAGDPTPDEIARIDATVRATTSRGWSHWWAYAAAALLLAAGAGGALAWPERTLVLPTPAPMMAARPEPAADFVLALHKPEIELPPESLTLRSASPDEYAAALERALDPFVRNDFDEAARRLEQIDLRFKGRPHPAYYLGVAHLMRGAPSEAVPALELARRRSGRDSSLYAAATWYLAVSLEQSGQRASAAVTLSELCGVGGSREIEACEGFRALLTR